MSTIDKCFKYKCTDRQQRTSIAFPLVSDRLADARHVNEAIIACVTRDLVHARHEHFGCRERRQMWRMVSANNMDVCSPYSTPILKVSRLSLCSTAAEYKYCNRNRIVVQTVPRACSPEPLTRLHIATSLPVTSVGDYEVAKASLTAGHVLRRCSPRCAYLGRSSEHCRGILY